jgi:hypothetical protein
MLSLRRDKPGLHRDQLLAASVQGVFGLLKLGLHLVGSQ